MRRRLVFFAVLFASSAIRSAPWAAGAKPPSKAGAETLKRVRFFLKTEVRDLPPEDIPAFLAVDPATLPAKLRDPFIAKREGLLALKKIADGKLKPAARLAGTEAPKETACAPETDPHLAKMLPSAGYARIAEDELQFIETQTRCNECELAQEFTLRIVEEPPSPNQQKSGKRKEAVRRGVRYFLHQQDVLWALVAAYRSGNKNPFGTDFFGLGGHPRCR